MTEKDEAWEMHEPKDNFSKQDEEDLLKMLQNMSITVTNQVRDQHLSFTTLRVASLKISSYIKVI
jgi:hypothetical protein